MRALFTLIVLVLLFPTLLSAQTLIGSWNFNGNANDGSGHNLNGTVYNATLTTGASGVANTAYQFNGYSSHIDVPFDSILNLTTWTIQTLVRVDGFNSSTCQQENIVCRGAIYGSNSYNLGFNDNTHDNSCSIYSPNNTEFLGGPAGNPSSNWHDANYIQLGTWYCYTATYNGSVLKVFINGNAVDSVQWSNQYNYTGTQPPLVFGYYPGGGSSYPYWFNGAIDQISIWSGVLSNAAISTNCSATSITITQPFTDTNKCAGSTLSVPFTIAGTFNSSNVFTAQLSNASGSFASPVNIGNLTSTSAGTISCSIPSNTVSGTGYRVRVVSSSPADTSTADSVNIRISSLSASILTSNSPICAGDSLKLTASNTTSGISYQWTDPNGTVTTQQNRTIIHATSANAGQYALLVSVGACTQHDTLAVVIKPLPASPVISANSPLCAGTTLSLIPVATTGATYSWTGPNNYTSTQQNPNRTVGVTDSGYYAVTATLNGCSIADTVHVNVLPAPTNVTYSTNGPICVGDTLKGFSSNSTSGVIYNWTGPNSFTSSQANFTIPHATAANAGVYSLVMSYGTCIVAQTVNVVVDPIPVRPTASSNSPVCAGTSLSLSALSITGATYVWNGPTGFVSTQQNTTRTVYVTDTGSYIVAATLNGCTSHDTTHVSVLPAPVNVTYGSNSPVCAGDTLKVTSNNATSGVTYSWTGPNSFSTGQQNFSIPHMASANAGSYYLTLSYNTCIVHDTINVVVNPLPARPTISSNSPVCAGTTLSLSAVATTSATYSWTGPTAFTAATRTTSRTVALTDSGYYMVTATLNGCKASDTAHVTVLPAPLGVTYSSNSPICAGDTLKVISGNNTAGVSYSWIGPNSFSSNQQNFTIPNATSANGGIYTLSVSYGSCIVTNTMGVTVKPLPAKPTITSNSPICSGNILTLTPVGTVGATYNWSGPTSFSSAVKNATRTVAVTDSGNYIVTATLNGCNASDTTHVVVYPSPAGVIYSSNSPVCSGDTLTMAATSSTPGVIYSWSGPGGYNSSQPNFSITGLTAGNAGKYDLAVTYNSCTVYDTVTVVVKPLPAVPTVGSNSPVCVAAFLNLTAFSGTSGVTYSWTGPNSYSSAVENPVISNITLGGVGIYTAKATLNGCSTTGTTSVTVNPIPVGTVGSNSPICAGSTLSLTSNITPSTITYSWTGPNGFISALPDPTLTNTTTAASGTYLLTALLGTCSNVLSVPVTIMPILGPPVVSVTTPTDTICSGDVATFTATATNGGSAPVYTWRVNGAATGATGSIYNTSTLNDGDLVSCNITGNAPCQPTNISNSNAIWMHVKSAHMPAMHITVNPEVYNPDMLVTLTAIAVGNTNCLTYQWRKNGVDIPGVTTSTFATYNLAKGDKMSLYVHSTCACTKPDTLVTNIISLDVNAVSASSAGYKVYPNPAQDEITIEGPTGSAQVELYDMGGKKILVTPVTLTSGTTKLRLSLAAGVYTMHLVDEKGNYCVERLVIIE